MLRGCNLNSFLKKGRKEIGPAGGNGKKGGEAED